MNVANLLWESIPLLLQLYANLYLKTDFDKTKVELETEFNVPKTKSFDFIVVGGGSAGCIVASRLSEHFDVLLLEAGGDPPPATTVPFYTPLTQRDPLINYFFKTAPQADDSLCCNRITNAHTGKMLGGSASHNSMMHSRGSPKDFDNWANILNDESFNYTNVLKYFKKMETFVGFKFGSEGDNNYGNDGPVIVKTNMIPLLDVWFDAGEELGYEVANPNGFQQEGFAPTNLAVRNGKRSNSYTEYIKPYQDSRRNLTVIRYANVNEVLLDNDNNAYGVAYTRHGIPQIAHSRKEIILSAGVFSSPLLLMKSGIGPQSVLNSAEIPVKVPLEAVGRNLIEHPTIPILGFRVNDSSVFVDTNPSLMANITEEYHRGEGLLTTHVTAASINDQGVLILTSVGAQCFITSSKAEIGWPDIWIEMQPFVSIDGTDKGINFYSVIGRPLSKGMITLDADKYISGLRDDVQLALIDYQLLAHPDDVDIMLEGVKTIFKIAETEAFKRINLTHTIMPNPACSDFTFLSDDYWKCEFRQKTESWMHMVGTCSLGADSSDSNTSVVDTKFRVRGVNNLRIVDASVIPMVTNSNLNAPVMMLAEKAADDIINFYN